MNYLTTAFLVISATAMAWGQLVPRPLERNVWHGDKVVTLGTSSFEVSSPHRAEPLKFACPMNTLDLRHFEGDFWILQRDPQAQRYTISRSENGMTWEPVATWPFPEGRKRAPRLFFHPLNGDCFILAGHLGAPMDIEGKPWPIVIARTDAKRRLHFTEPFDLGLKAPWLKSVGGRQSVHPDHHWVLSMLNSDPFLTTGSKVYLAATQIGAFIEVRPNGRPGRTIRLFPGLDEDRIRRTETFDWAVLCAQPTRYGEVLVASRTEAGVLEGQKLVPRTYTTATLQGAAQAETAARDLRALQGEPRIEWWLLDGESGKFQTAPPPRHVPQRFDSVRELQEFGFVWDPRGNLRFSYWKKTTKP